MTLRANDPLNPDLHLNVKKFWMKRRETHNSSCDRKQSNIPSLDSLPTQAAALHPQYTNLDRQNILFLTLSLPFPLKREGRGLGWRFESSKYQLTKKEIRNWLDFLDSSAGWSDPSKANLQRGGYYWSLVLQVVDVAKDYLPQDYLLHIIN